MQWIIACLLLIIPFTRGVKHELFKTCNQAPYCRHNRLFADRAAAAQGEWTSPYTIAGESLVFEKGQLTGSIFKDIGFDQIEFPFKLTFIESGGVRLTIDEKKRQTGEIDIPDSAKIQKARYNETDKWAFVPGAIRVDDSVKLQTKDKDGEWRFSYGSDLELVVKTNPFEIQARRNGVEQVVLNERGLLNVEEWRVRPGENETDPHSHSGEDQQLLFGDSFQGKRDTKPRGPESVALDVSFVGYQHVYGIPEHADRLDLRETRSGEPYRLFNVDIFEYEVNSPMSMYGAIPFMQAAKPGTSCGILWLNSADTWIDIEKDDQGTTKTHWMSESGVLDIFIFVGETPQDVFKQYGSLVGFTRVPLLSSVGYHQCRWNYNSQDDVLDVNENFDKSLVPYDMIWLDIEYLDDKKYFTWNPSTFPDPEKMANELGRGKRKLVAIIDPHIKKADHYSVYSDLVEQKLATLNKDSEIFEGQCWPATSIWVDSFSPPAVKYWKSLHKAGVFVGDADNICIWNDMNEPSVFDGPEGVFPRDNIHYGGWEHRDVHNVNGHTLLEATYEGLLERFGQDKTKVVERPFILSRSYFAGTSRLAAVWTGDNQAKWEYLGISIPMVLSSGIAGQTFNGADVGGFFGDPSSELLTRWYQMGAFYPFFRAHAHIDSKRREPYLIEEPYRGIIGDAIRLRYQLLPMIYSAFYRASVDGSPVLRPLYVTNPENVAGYGIDNEFFLGDSGLLVHPVTSANTHEVDVYLPDGKVYYDYFDYREYQATGGASGGEVKVPAPLDKVPILAREGSVIVRRDRNRRSSELARFDPVTVVVFINKVDGTARGEVYFDDGKSFGYAGGDSLQLAIEYDGGVLRSKVTRGKGEFVTQVERAKVRVEKVILVGGSTKSLAECKVGQKGKTWHAPVVQNNGKVVIIRDPKVHIAYDWEVSL